MTLGEKYQHQRKLKQKERKLAAKKAAEAAAEAEEELQARMADPFIRRQLEAEGLVRVLLLSCPAP